MSVLPTTPLPGQTSTYGRLWDIAAGILVQIEAMIGPVDVAFVGSPVGEFGCDLLAVQWINTRAGVPGVPNPPGAITAASMMLGEYDVALRRELPSGGTDDHGQPLPFDDLTAINAAVLAEANAALVGVLAEVVAWTFLGPAAEVAVVSLDSFGPEGGVIGWTLKLEVGLA